MKLRRVQPRTLALGAIVVGLLVVFLRVATRSGPLAPVPVTVTTVESRPLSPALFGIGTVQARYTYKIGPTAAGRIERLDAQVGDVVRAGAVLGQMDPVDLGDRIAAQEAAIASATAAERQAAAKQAFAQTQLSRYQPLFNERIISAELLATKQQELSVADAALGAARQDSARLRADLDALRAQRRNLVLTAPLAGLVVARDADPGTTVVAGQAVIEIVDPARLWVNARFDQVRAQGLRAGLAAELVLRSRQGQTSRGHVLRVEPLADAVTEETLAKIVFDAKPSPLPPIGELAEVTVTLPEQPPAPTIPDAALRELDGQRGVWTFPDGRLAFVPLAPGPSDLAGHVQVDSGRLAVGDQVVVYSERTLTRGDRVRIVPTIPGVTP